MKNFIALLIFAGIFGAGGWYFYSKETTAGTRELTEQLPILEARIAAQQAEITKMTTAFELQKKANATRQALAIVTGQQKAASAQKTALLLEKQKLLSSGRQSLIGVVLTDVTLADGRKFDKAKIIKVDDTGVSLAVSSGVLRIPPNELTPEMRAYFRF